MSQPTANQAPIYSVWIDNHDELYVKAGPNDWRNIMIGDKVIRYTDGEIDEFGGHPAPAR
jgi:hypothetical protein